MDFWLPFLTALGVMTVLTALLAVLMVIADATLGDYGDVTVTVNGERELTVRGGRSLLSTLKENGIFIPSACGGRGSCGLCKLRVEEGAGDPLPTELPWLTPDEIQRRVRLSCQVKVRRPLRIHIPPELFAIRQYPARVAALRDLTYDIKEVVLTLDEPGGLTFKAGQFIQFEVPEYARNPEPVYRAYSIASPPSQRDRIELEIRRVPNGICTTYVFDHLKIGDRVIFNGPHGDFHLRDSPRDILCVAGGSGMAPIKSILWDMRDREIHRKTTYFFGARTRRDLFLMDELQALEKERPEFTFVPALSRPAPDDDWSGEQGLITEVIRRRYGEGTHTDAYLCGSPGMIDACIAVLHEKGIPDDRIFYDKFA